jgi:flagellar biosynthesis protein FlhB
MMAEEPAGERTEKATPRRREKARDKGQVARSQEVNSFFVLLSGAIMLVGTSGYMLDQLARETSYLLSQAHFLRPEGPAAFEFLITGSGRSFLRILAPLSCLILLAALIANIMQVGLRLTPNAMAFRWSRMNPITGAKRFFQKQAFFDLLKNMLKVGMISLLCWAVVRHLMPEINASSVLPLPLILDLARSSYIKLMGVLLAFLALLALMDWIFQKQQHESQLKMSKQEVKQEHKEFEGDPQIKARVRALQYEAARRRMLAEVPKSDVVITNPTHYAVALKYEPGKAAPVVVAKGADHLAQKIREAARQARVPVVQNKTVARALYALVDIGRPIPESLYQAVAEILAYVYRLKRA